MSQRVNVLSHWLLGTHTLLLCRGAQKFTGAAGHFCSTRGFFAHTLGHSGVQSQALDGT